jgi:hypothetical protein
MQSSFVMSRLLGFKDFFPNEVPLTKEQYGLRLGKNFLIEVCTHFLSYYRYNAIPSNEELIKEWFTINEIKFYNVPFYHYVINRYNYLKDNASNEHFEILCVESFLKLFIWVNGCSAIVDKVENLNIQSTNYLFQLYLLFNDDVLDCYEKAVKSVENYEGVDKIQRMLLAMTFPQADFFNADYFQVVNTQMYKAIKLLDYISTNPDYQTLFAKFLNDYYCSSKEEYFKSIASAVVLPLMNKKPGWSNLKLLEGNTYYKDRLFIEKITVESNDTKLYEQNDYLSLRSRPLFKISEGEYRVIYDLFLIKKIYNGLLFLLSDLVNSDKQLFKRNFLGSIRNEFSEGILVYEILQSIYSLYNMVQFNGNEFKAVGLQREPDYYIRNEHTILLFESKDFYIPGEIKLSYDFNKIEAELKKDRLDKAVKQLIKNIERVLSKEMILDTSYDVNKISILPIIVVHDSLYSAAALNCWVNYWFEDGLRTLQQRTLLKHFDFSKVLPLTVVEIDTLIIYEKHFKRGEINFESLLYNYQNFVSFRRIDFVTIEDKKKHAYDSAISFDQFVRSECLKMQIVPDREILYNMLRKYGIT